MQLFIQLSCFYILHAGENRYVLINAFKGRYSALNEVMLIYFYLENSTGMMCNKYFFEHPDST